MVSRIGEEREIVFRGYWDSSALETQYETSMNKMSAGFVNRISKMSEGAAKARFVIAQFGDEIGRATGILPMLVSHIAYLCSRLNPLELAVMGVTAAIGGLVYWVSRETEEEARWRRSMEQTEKRIDALSKRADELTKLRLQEGMSDVEKQLEEVNQAWAEQEKRLQAVIVRIKEWESQATAQQLLLKEYPEELTTAYARELLAFGKIEKARVQLMEEMRHIAFREKAKFDQEVLVQERENRSEQIRAEFEAYKKRIENAKGFAENKIRLEWELQGRHMEMLRAAYEAERRYEEDRKKEVEAALEYFHNLRLENEDRANAIRTREIEREQEMLRNEIEAREQTLRNTIDLFSEFAAVVTRGTKAEVGARIAAIVLEAGYQIGVEMAKGFSALGAMNPWAAAMHFTSAGLWAAVAAGRIQQVASSGGGHGTSVSARAGGESEWRPQRPESRELHVHVWMGRKKVGDAVIEAIEAERDRTNPGRKRVKVV